MLSGKGSTKHQRLPVDDAVMFGEGTKKSFSSKI
jgi:hypothetical protein